MDTIGLFLITYSVLLVQGKSSVRYCDIPSNDPTKQCYVKETLISIAHSPNQLAVEKLSNALYFSFDYGQGEYVPAILRLDTKKLTVLKGVKDAYAIASDPASNEIYFGGSHGIYKYNPLNKDLKRLNRNHLDVWWLYIKKNIYFVKFPSLNAYCYKNKTIKEIRELGNNVIHQFVFDKGGDVFFINNTGFYGIKRGSKKAILLRNSPKFHGMATDNHGYVHVCSEDGIYVVSKIIQKVKKIVSIDGVLGLAFDKQNNIIYSDSHDLIRLVPLLKGNFVHPG